MRVQLYKGGQSVWATGTDRGQTKPTVLNVQVRVQTPPSAPTPPSPASRLLFYGLQQARQSNNFDA